MSRVWWRGVLLDSRTRDMVVEVADVRNTGTIYVKPTQGSYSTSVGASAGTHAGCGAIDIGGPAGSMPKIVEAMRRVGFAAWVRTPYQSSWPWHIHAIAVQPGGKWDRGCLSRAAHGQIVDYYEGRNGLASRARDDGPRDWVGVTWEQAKPQGDEFDMADIDDLDRIVRKYALSEADVRSIVRDESRSAISGTNRRLASLNEAVRVLFARQRKMYRKTIEGPAGYDIGEKWRPTDEPVDPGYEDKTEPEELPMASEMLRVNGWPKTKIPIALAVFWSEGWSDEHKAGGFIDAVGDLHLIDEKWGPSCGWVQYRTMKNVPTSGYKPDTYRDIEKLRDPNYQAEAALVLQKAAGWEQWSAYQPDDPGFKARVGVDYRLRTGHEKAGCWSLDGCPQ